MAVSPILMGGVVQRADDIGVLKNQQDTRPVVEQQNAQTQVVKNVDKQLHQVVTARDSDKTDTHADAREKGKNAYFSRKKGKGKQEQNVLENHVVKKSMGGFDMKV